MDAVLELPVGFPHYEGKPVPYTTFRDEEGVPDWGVTVQERWHECIQHRLCGFCGQPLGYWIAFIGSDQACRLRLFFDAAMHEPCARFVLKECPYFNGTQLTGDTNSSDRLARQDDTAEIIQIDEPPRDKVQIGLYITRDYKTVLSRGRLFIKPAPARSVEWIDAGVLPSS